MARASRGGLLPVGRFATGGLRPDLTILLDVPVGSAWRVRRARRRHAFEADFDRAYHERVRAGYLELAAARRIAG